MNRRNFLALTLDATLAPQAISAQASGHVVLALPSDVLRDTRNFLAGRLPERIDDYSGKNARRDVVEVILAHKALRIGEYSAEIQWVEIDSYIRSIREVAFGTVTMAATSVWKADIPSDDLRLITTRALIPEGAFEAGLYAHPSRTQALAHQLPDGLEKISVVCNPAWATDWKTLKALGFGGMQIARTWHSMVSMVSQQHADVLLAPFPSGQSLNIEVNGHVLSPVPGWKISLQGSRHWVLSRTHAASNAAVRALVSGLDTLVRRQEIMRAYQESGFINEKVRSWPTLSRGLR